MATARSVDGGVGDKAGEVGCGVGELDALDGRTTSRSAAESLAEDKM